MIIANVIHDGELINHTKVDYINYVKDSVEYDSIDKSLPTLYVGWSFMKDSNKSNEIIQNANILHKQIIINELYWEFSFSESKPSHVKGVDLFTSLAPKFYFESKYSYLNVDPVFSKLFNVEDLMGVLPKEIDYMYTYKNEMVYLLNENKIWGINLKMFEFFQFNIDDIISRLNERHVETPFNDVEGVIYQEYYKKFPKFSRLKRYIIVMLSK